MDDPARMIAAARRSARRMAKKTDLTYQQALDYVARSLGRDHWAHYVADPVPVPREEDGVTSVVQVGFEPHRTPASRSVEFFPDASPGSRLTLDTWNVVQERRFAEFGDMPFVPAFNALADRYVGRGVSGSVREAQVGDMALVLIPVPDRGGDTYFHQKGRQTLEGLIMAEVAFGLQEGRTSSIPAMLAWMRDGHLQAGDDVRGWLRGPRGMTDQMPEWAKIEGFDPKIRPDWFGNAVGMWIARIVAAVEDVAMRGYVSHRLSPLVHMHDKERSGLLGTADQGLLPFKNREVASLNV